VKTVLVVDDEPKIVDVVREYLEHAGFSVRTAGDGPAALERARALAPDLVVLDLGLPGLDGLDVARQLRRSSRVPVIILTARGDEVDRIIGLELGADDYLVKPFGFRELLARIRAVTRRRTPRTEAAMSELGGLVIDRRSRRVLVDGEDVSLTAKEFDLLAYLADDPGAVRSRQQVLEEVWDPHWFGPTKTLDVHVASLRKKLGDPGWIETIRGVGFRFHPLVLGVDPAHDSLGAAGGIASRGA